MEITSPKNREIRNDLRNTTEELTYIHHLYLLSIKAAGITPTTCKDSSLWIAPPIPMIDHQSEAANTEGRLIISNSTPVTGSSLERKGDFGQRCV